MFDIIRKPDCINIVDVGKKKDSTVRINIDESKMFVYIKANEGRPKYVSLRWNFNIEGPIKLLGDKWERSYGDLTWSSINPDGFMPWYFLANKGEETTGCGVMVQPNSFVCFECDASGVTGWFDVRCGGDGVKLNGRELLMGVVVCKNYNGISPFSAAKEFCKVMSPNPISPKDAVYGSNNWYYAYGKSSYDEIINDAKIIADITKNIDNRPFMVIDDGWQLNPCAGPWLPNKKFGYMNKITEEFKKLDVKPGIWFRPLHDIEIEKEHYDWRIKTFNGLPGFLDPSHPMVQEYIKNTVDTIKKWGFQLIKHDYSTVDMFGNYGYTLNGKISVNDNWTFYNKEKTSAEIVLDFYRLIRQAAGEMCIIGCNTVSHLCAGLVEINRIGDDTSGRLWYRTRTYGVNTLAFRMCQNGTFYTIDADCVGILDKNIPWELNRQWLDLLAKSGSPLFISVKPESLTKQIYSDLKSAFEINALQKDHAEPIDWLYNNIPQEWLINGEKKRYDFVMNLYPMLLKEKNQPY